MPSESCLLQFCSGQSAASRNSPLQPFEEKVGKCMFSKSHIPHLTFGPDHTGADLSHWIATVEGRLAQVTMELQQVRQEMNSEHRHFSSSFIIPQLLHEQFCHNFILSAYFTFMYITVN